MKNLKKILCLTIMLLALVPFISVKALDIDEYFNAADDVTDTGNYNHSRLVAGKSIISKSTIYGVSFVAGDDLTIDSNSEYGLFAGNTIDIKGNVEKDLFIAGNKVVLDDKAVIGRDVFIAANKVDINTNIEGNVFIAASKVEFNDVTINGDVSLSTSNISFSGDVVINGELKYNEDTKINGEKNASIDELSKYEIAKVKKMTFVDKLFTRMLHVLALITLAFMINLIFPKIYKKISKDIDTSKVLKNIGVGFCGMIIIPILSIATLFTVVGIVFGLLSLGIYGICISLASLTAMSVVGSAILTKVFNSKDNSYLSILIGIITLSIISLIPVFGAVMSFLLMLFGLGLIFETIKNNR